MVHKTRATGPLLVLRSRSAFFSGLVPLLVLRPRPPFLLWSSPVSGCTVQIRCWLHGHARLFCSGLVPFLVARSRSALLSESSLFLGYTDPQIHIHVFLVFAAPVRSLFRVHCGGSVRLTIVTRSVHKHVAHVSSLPNRYLTLFTTSSVWVCASYAQFCISSFSCRQ